VTPSALQEDSRDEHAPDSPDQPPPSGRHLLLGTGYLSIMGTAFVAASVLPTIAGTDPSYVNDVLAAATGGTANGDIGLLQPAILVQNVTYLAGGVVTVTLSVLPDAFFRLLAFPNGIAMIALGYSLWLTSRTDSTTQPSALESARLAAAGAE
jgi:hypothetical protein